MEILTSELARIAAIDSIPRRGVDGNEPTCGRKSGGWNTDLTPTMKRPSKQGSPARVGAVQYGHNFSNQSQVYRLCHVDNDVHAYRARDHFLQWKIALAWQVGEHHVVSPVMAADAATIRALVDLSCEVT